MEPVDHRMLSPLIDSHCHLDLEVFDADRDAVMARAETSGVNAGIIPAIAAVYWPRLIALHAAYPSWHFALGLHPLWLHCHRPEHLDDLEHSLATTDAIAVGECGLDGWRTPLDWRDQCRYFDAQLAIAVNLQLPLIIHGRRALDSVLQRLRRYPGARGVVHSFVGSEQQAQQLIDRGFYLGVGGPITYERAKRLRRVVATLPDDVLLLETDAPDQPLWGHQGQRNEPARVVDVLHCVAQQRQQSPQTLAAATTANARRLFALGKVER